ncbi:MAG: glycosyltransferase family 4 protein [Vicinamibacteria bacterium]
MRICYIGDARSVHMQRWALWFGKKHEVVLVRTVADEALPEVPGPALPATGRLPGQRLARSVSALRGVLRSTRVDILHAHFINEAGWFAAASRFRPYVLTVWGSDVYQAPKVWPGALLNRWAARLADHVTCDSRDQAKRIEEWGVRPERVSVVGWGIDTASFRPGLDRSRWRRRLGIPPDAPVVFSPRQWVPNSNIEVVVAAHARLSEDVYLLLKRLPRFEGPHAKHVQRTVEESPARSRIRTVSYVPEDELPGLYAAADCLVTLCGTDGTPVSVLEGMGIGLPVVALGIPSLREWVAEPGGLLCASLDPAGVAAALRNFVDSPAARQRAAEHNVNQIAARACREHEMGRIEALYERLHRGNV